LLGQKKDTSTCLTTNDKKVVRLIINDLKTCEENSKEKDTIIRDMTIRYMIKDSAHSESKKEVNRLKIENKSLYNKYTEETAKTQKLTYICYGLGGLVLIQTLLVIGLL